MISSYVLKTNWIQIRPLRAETSERKVNLEMKNKLNGPLVKVAFYLTFIAFVLVHLGVVASVLMHLFSGEWLEALSYLFIYPAIWLGNGGIAIMAALWSYPLTIAAYYLITKRLIRRPWEL